MTSRTPHLFQPTQAGAIPLANRVVMAPMTRNRADRAGVPSPLAAAYYSQRASAGLIVTEATQVIPEGLGYPGTPGIHDGAQIAAWRPITQAVHQAGGRIVLQLWHVGRISHPSLQPGGALPVAPSAIRPDVQAMTYEGLQPMVTPRALETGELPGIVEAYRRGAENARTAGFDGVELHAANGYLLDQFLRDGTNHRDDTYGGSIDNRARLLLEVTEAVAGVWGADRVGVRLSPLGSFNDMADSHPETTFARVVRLLDSQGIAYLHMVETGADELPTAAEMATIRRIRMGWTGFYIACGGYDRSRAASAVASGHADAVAFARPYVANPDLVHRLRIAAPLAIPDRATLYGGGAMGYADYPPLARAA